jgi:putative protease
MTARKTSRRKPVHKKGKKAKAAGKPASKPTRRKAAGKKPTRKKAAPKQATRKKSAAKKSAGKRATRKKSARKKAAPKKAVRQKPVRKKAARKPAARPARAATPEPQPLETVRTSVAAAIPVEVGRVTHHFGQVGVGVIAVENQEIRLGDTLHFRGHTTDFFQRVERMELDHQPVEHIGSGQQVAIQVSQRVREGDLVYRVSR